MTKSRLILIQSFSIEFILRYAVFDFIWIEIFSNATRYVYIHAEKVRRRPYITRIAAWRCKKKHKARSALEPKKSIGENRLSVIVSAAIVTASDVFPGAGGFCAKLSRYTRFLIDCQSASGTMAREAWSID